MFLIGNSNCISGYENSKRRSEIIANINKGNPIKYFYHKCRSRIDEKNKNGAIKGGKTYQKLTSTSDVSDNEDDSAACSSYSFDAKTSSIWTRSRNKTDSIRGHCSEIENSTYEDIISELFDHTPKYTDFVFKYTDVQDPLIVVLGIGSYECEANLRDIIDDYQDCIKGFTNKYKCSVLFRNLDNENVYVSNKTTKPIDELLDDMALCWRENEIIEFCKTACRTIIINKHD